MINRVPLSLRWKDSVSFVGLHPVMILAALRAGEIYARLGYECWITSANDSTHMEGSKHYDGRAIDLRTKNLFDAHVELVYSQLRVALGPEFTVLLESHGKANEHIHIQYNR